MFNQIRTADFCDVAAELVSLHGHAALDMARRASAECACDGADEHALFWYALSLFLDDIVSRRIDPERLLTIH